jgi:hypothetical protein
MKISARNNKKVWEKPAIDLMNIKRDTFSGSGQAPEKGNPGDQAKYPTATPSRGSRG